MIVGYDGSDCAKAALRTAVQVAMAYGEPLTIAFGYEVSPVGGELHDYHAALREFATERLGEAQELAVAEGLELTRSSSSRSRPAALIALARERDARVIVVGTRGEGRSAARCSARSRTSCCSSPTARCWSFPPTEGGGGRLAALADELDRRIVAAGSTAETTIGGGVVYRNHRLPQIRHLNVVALTAPLHPGSARRR